MKNKEILETGGNKMKNKRKYIAGFTEDKNTDKSLVKTKYKFFEFESFSRAGSNKNYEDAVREAKRLYGFDEIEISVIRLV